MTGSVSPRRADTRRNHERILVAAAEALSACGEVSFNTIAKRAGVGVGTVYRHFPTPSALILAVYDREVRQLVDVVPELLADLGPEQTFLTWTNEYLAPYMMTKRGLAKALAAASAAQDELPFSAVQAIDGAVSTVLKANIDAGIVRRDVTSETVMRGLLGLLHLDPEGDWQSQTAELTALLWRGMRA